MPHKYDILVSPNEDANVPDGDGYYLSRSLLDEVNSSPETLSVSMLMGGPFRSGTESHTKRVLGGETYRIRVSVTDDTESDALDALVEPYLNNDVPITLDGTAFEVLSHDRESASMDDIWATATEHADAQPEVVIDFNTPTCVVHPRSTVTEMFPHRRSIFPQLAAIWNTALEQNEAGGSLKFALDPFDVGAQVFEKPHATSYRTYSTLTDIREDADGDEMPFFRQGYIGTCEYGFRNADDAVVKTILALSLFAEYSGIGADTNHGCGCVTADIKAGGR